MPGLLFGLLVLAVYADPLLLRRNFTGRDLPTYQLPMEKAVHDAWARGRAPVWVEEISGGRPLLPNPNSGAFYPPRMAMAVLPFPMAARVFPVLHWIAAGLGMMALLRASGVSRSGAFVGACTYAFSGVAVSLVFYPYLPGMALLPWIVLAARRAATGGAGAILLLSMLLGLDLLAGEVFTIVLALAAAALWFLTESPPQRWARSFGALGAGLVLALLLAAPQWLATALWIPETRRAVRGITIEEAIYFSVSPLRLLELFVPYPFGRTWSPGAGAVWGQPVFHGKTIGLFATLYGGALAIAGLVLRPDRSTTGGRFARWLFGSSMAAAVVPALLPAALYRFRAPIALRYPEKFSIAALCGLSVVAGLAVDAFGRGKSRTPTLLAVGAVLATLAGLAFLLPRRTGRIAVSLTGSPPGAEAIAAVRVPEALTEAALLWVATVGGIALLRRKAAGRVVGVALLAGIPVLANRRIAATARPEEVLAPTPFARFVAAKDPDRRFRIFGESLYLAPSALEATAIGSDIGLTDLARRHWYEYEGALWNRGTVLNVDFDSGDLSRVDSLREVARVAAGYRDSSPFFGSLSLAWGIRFRDQPPISGYGRVGGDSLQDWDAHTQAFPDIRMTPRWRGVSSAVEALRSIPRLAPGEVVVETGALEAGMTRPARIELLERSPERLRLVVETPDPGYLFVLRAFWSHRRVTVDGRTAEVFPSQLAYSAVAIPAGRHSVDWREQVPGFSISRWGPLLYLLCAVALLTRARRVPAR